MKTTAYIFKLLLAISLMSCETVIDFEIPQEDPKIVIDAQIIGGDSVQAWISISRPALSTQRPLVDTTATVYLYENNLKVAQLKPESSGPDYYTYKSTYLPQANNYYKIEALREGLSTAFGQTFLKEAVPVNILSLDTTTGEVSISIQDPPGKGDYYRIIFYYRDMFMYKGSFILLTQDPFAETFQSEGDGVFEIDGAKNVKVNNFFYLSDEYFDGTSRKFNFTIGQAVEFSPNAEYYLEVMRVSDDHYKYVSSKIMQDQSIDFFSEPVQVYSNIQNGYGIVAAAAPTTIKVYP